MGVEPDEYGNILDLDEPTISPYREQCLYDFMQMLVKAEEGYIRAYTALLDVGDGEYEMWWSGADDTSEMGVRLVTLGLRRMGFVMKDQLENFVRREEFE